MTITNGNEHQTTSAPTSAKADHLSYVHECPANPSSPIAVSVWFTKPRVGSNRNSHTAEPVIAGVAHAPSDARKSTVRDHGRSRVASRASAPPTASVAATHAAANTTVLPSTVQNASSPSSRA